MSRVYVGLRLKARVKLSQELSSLPGTCAEIITYIVFNCSVIFVEKHEHDLLTGPIYSQMLPFGKSLIYEGICMVFHFFCGSFFTLAKMHWQNSSGSFFC